MSSDLIIRGRNVVLRNSVERVSIHIANGVISSVGPFEQSIPGVEMIDVDDDSVVMPGLVDTHVHINSPGRTEWEGFESATLAAAAGGVTTLIDMPLNSIPATTSVAHFEKKLETAAGKCHVDLGFWGGVVPGNTSELAGMCEAGVVGFKCFLVPSGVDEFPHVTEADLREALPELSRLDSLLIVHAELPGPIDEHSGGGGDQKSYQTFLRSRPRAAEDEAVAMMIRLSREFDTRVHIVHLSSSDALPLIRKAQAAGVKITAETCPHYLHFAAESIGDGSTEFKCCPPIREGENREQLWRGLADGTIGTVVSDHSPCPASMKLPETGDFMHAWGGIASLQLRLPVVWTEAQGRGLSIPRISEWMCSGPAALVGLERSKGSIKVGADADLVIWSPAKRFEVKPEDLEHRHKISPYAGELLSGVVEKTFLRGRKIYDVATGHDEVSGQLIL
ncbi:MAG: allantoinase AllB [Blastocatellia bacterium]|nr:MAG: allantoinase AllB [Blastocatellia bacterium]